MSQPHLILGNKAYSSWSLRPWLAMRHTGIAFSEEVVPLDGDDWRRRQPQLPSGRVPVLRHGEREIWDSLAILEYVNELDPDRGLWPSDPYARAVARSVSAEMHSGFATLREHLPMNLRAKPGRREAPPQVERDVARIVALWADCRARFGAAGPFLFGAFTIADAMYAPVATRFVTYAVPLPAEAKAYVDTLLALPAMVEWYDAAKREPWTITSYETAP